MSCVEAKQQQGPHITRFNHEVTVFSSHSSQPPPLTLHLWALPNIGQSALIACSMCQSFIQVTITIGPCHQVDTLININITKSLVLSKQYWVVISINLLMVKRFLRRNIFETCSVLETLTTKVIDSQTQNKRSSKSICSKAIHSEYISIYFAHFIFFYLILIYFNLTKF